MMLLTKQTASIILGKGEADSSILSGSTIKPLTTLRNRTFGQMLGSERSAYSRRTYWHPAPYGVQKACSLFRACSEVKMQEPCFVYAMAAGKFVKIGIAADVNRRLGNVRSGALEVEIICKRRMPNRATALKAEKAIHTALAKHCHRREWFVVKPSRAKAVLSRHCARVRLAAAIEARKASTGNISMREYLEPKLPLALVGMSALEEWQWRKQQRAAYGAALERGDLKLA